jgi:phosphate butyryltransferase
MIYSDFEHLLEQARARTDAERTVAVVAAEDDHTLEAVIQTRDLGFISSVLVGRGPRIEEELKKLGQNPGDFHIVDAATPEEAVFTAADLVNAGRADFLMKGLIETPILIRTGGLISHVCFVKIPSYHKLVAITDIALNIAPDLEQKQLILQNAVDAMLRMGFDEPLAAVLAANERVSPKMVETVDAAELKRRNQEGLIRNCVVEGPLSYDLAISAKVASVKGCDSPVPGNVDLMLAPNISAGNILLKALVYSAGAHRAGIVVGGRVPMVLPSRAAVAEDKFLPMVLAAAAA